MKKTVLYAIALIAGLFPATITAQMASYSFQPTAKTHDQESVFEKMNRHGVFNTIEIAANIGTTGLGLEVASPMTEWAKLCGLRLHAAVHCPDELRDAELRRRQSQR